jgi:outer membrane protein OmpA-like peptidoglycan-associated protein
MTKSLVDTIRQAITPSVVSQLSDAFRQSTPAVEKGLLGTTAALLGSIAARSDDRSFMSQLFSLVTEPAAGATFDAPERLLEQTQRATAEPGGLLSRFQSMLLRNRGPAVDALARYAGLNTSTASSLLGVAASLVLGHLTRLVRQDQLDAGSLARRLAHERSSINAAIPAALASFSTPGAPSATSRPIRTVGERTVATPSAHQSSSLPWVAAALVGAVALFGLFSILRVARQPELPAVSAPPSVGTSGYETPTIPGRTDLRFPPSAMEGHLLTYIETASPSNREVWFEFDRVGFEPDSATLRPDSRGQLADIAAILRAHPRVRVKIGGYTDNSGDPATNLRLSQAKASAVAAELRALGVEGDRIVAEGFGDQYPIADNSTAEGRARNRRVAIRVISK